jgi:peptide/nickel transport system permease protein
MGLKEYIIRRVIMLVPIMLGVVILIFAVLQFVPANARAQIYATSPRELTPEGLRRLVVEYGLDAPIYQQFYTWIGRLIQGNFGASVIDGGLPVTEGLMRRLPATAEIVLASAPFIVLFGVWLGTVSAVNRDKLPDHISRVGSILFTSLPSFFFGVLLLAFFNDVGIPTGGRVTNRGLLQPAISSGAFRQYTGLMTLDGLLNGNFPLILDALLHLIGPALVLIFIQSATMVRVTRSSMLEALGKTYIVAARAKGLSRKETIYRHARRNALIPVVTISGLLVGGMFTGLTITETVFSFGGIGSWAAQSAIRLDVAVVFLYAMFSALVFVLSNLIVDILYAYVDPRIRLG